MECQTYKKYGKKFKMKNETQIPIKYHWVIKHHKKKDLCLKKKSSNF